MLKLLQSYISKSRRDEYEDGEGLEEDVHGLGHGRLSRDGRGDWRKLSTCKKLQDILSIMMSQRGESEAWQGDISILRQDTENRLVCACTGEDKDQKTVRKSNLEQ